MLLNKFLVYAIYLINFSHLAKYHDNTIHVPKGLPKVAYKYYNEN